jgi:restriction endonuclease S subunit
VHRAETDGSCSTEFHVLRISDTERVLSDYLAAILRSKVVLAQTVHMMTGNTHPRLANADVENLRVPIPRMDIQAAIRAEVIRRREESRQIKVEAEANWQASKQWFEDQLLGATSS